MDILVDKLQKTLTSNYNRGFEIPRILDIQGMNETCVNWVDFQEKRNSKLICTPNIEFKASVQKFIQGAEAINCKILASLEVGQPIKFKIVASENGN